MDWEEGRRRWMGGGFAMTTLRQEDGWADPLHERDQKCQYL